MKSAHVMMLIYVERNRLFGTEETRLKAVIGLAFFAQPVT
jgi:hypothetical protein